MIFAGGVQEPGDARRTRGPRYLQSSSQHRDRRTALRCPHSRGYHLIVVQCWFTCPLLHLRPQDVVSTSFRASSAASWTLTSCRPW